MMLRKTIRYLAVGSILVVGPFISLPDDGPSIAPCPLAVEIAREDLENAGVALEVARRNFAAREEIFGLIAGLWEIDAIERMIYLRAKYNRDAASLGLERAELDLERKSALLEQIRLSCASAGAEQRSRSLRGYREAQCAMRGKEIEIAEVNLVYRRELLASQQRLRAGEVATRQDVILARLGVEEEEVRLARGKELLTHCLEELEATDGDR